MKVLEKKIQFIGHLKQFNRKALVCGESQIRLTIDAVGNQREQMGLMKLLADIEGDDILKVSIVKFNN